MAAFEEDGGEIRKGDDVNVPSPRSTPASPLSSSGAMSPVPAPARTQHGVRVRGDGESLRAWWPNGSDMSAARAGDHGLTFDCTTAVRVAEDEVRSAKVQASEASQIAVAARLAALDEKVD